MAANPCSHGEVLGLRRLLLCLALAGFAAVPVAALRPKTAKLKGHTLEDLLVSNITASDVEHNDVMRFVREGIAYMEHLGVKLSEECQRRYGYTFITEQKFHHFRLCKSEAKLDSDGKLVGVQQGTSPLAKYRDRYFKRLESKRSRTKAATAIEASSATVALTEGSGFAGSSGNSSASSGGGSSSTSTTATAKRRSMAQRRGAARGAEPDMGQRSRGRQFAEHPEHQARRHRRTPDGVELTASEGSGRRLPGGAGRRLQAAGNGSALIYKLLSQISSRAHDDNGGGSSEDYDDDGEGRADEAGDAAEDDDVSGDDHKGGAAGADTSINGAGGAAARRAGADDPSPFEPDTEVPELSAVGTSYKSSVGCYLHPAMPRHLGYKDGQLLCVGRNVVLDTCALYDGQNEGFDVRFPKPKVGSLKLACSVQVQLLADRNLTKGYKNRLWWLNAQDNAYDTVRQSCDPSSGRVVEHPVAFIMRDRYTHTLHELEMLANIFTSLAVADLPEVRERGVQIVIADQMPHASYRPTYAAASYPYRLRHLAEAPYPPNTCFRTALFINAYTNSIVFNPNPNTSTCFSPIMVGVHRWLRTLHKELDPAYLARVHHHASETGGIVRRAVVWASRRNLEALRLTSGAGMTEWQSARMVPNENELVTALQSAILRWNSRSCLLARYYEGDEGLAGCRDSNVQLDLVFGEFSDWPYYPDQLMTVYRTGVMIGVHGAALTFVASTPLGESALIELAKLGWEDTQTGNMLNLFPSLAHNLGAYYEQVRYQGPDIDIKVATDALVRAMDEVSRRITARQLSSKQAEALQFNDQYNFDIMFPQACPTSVSNKLRRYVANHPVQMALNASSGNASGGVSSGESSASGGAGMH